MLDRQEISELLIPHVIVAHLVRAVVAARAELCTKCVALHTVAGNTDAAARMVHRVRDQKKVTQSPVVAQLQRQAQAEQRGVAGVADGW